MIVKLSLCLILAHFASAQFEGPANFIRVKMDNFSNWLTAHNLDPSPIQLGVDQFEARNEITNLSCSIAYHAVRGHSSNITVKDISFNVLLLTFTLDFEMSDNITFYGEYTVSGTVNLEPISSVGVWHITVPTVRLSSFKAQLFVQIVGNYVTVRSYSLQDILISDEKGYDIHFESLLEQDGAIGYEEYIEQALFDGYANHISASNNDSLRMLYMTFWNEAFQNVTLDDLIEATLPPPTTTDANTTPTTITTTRATTQQTTTTDHPNECPSSGTDLIPHPTSCSKYFLCVEGNAYEQECADGLHFNPLIKECDFPENINCTKPLPECPPEGVSFHPYPGNCTLYVICAEGTPLVRHCAEGTCFDPDELKCTANDTIAYDIPRQVQTYPDSTEFGFDSSLCRKQTLQGVSLVPNLNKVNRFTVCDKGIYKATFICPVFHVFDPQVKDCIMG